MRNLKKFLAVIVVVTMILSTMMVSVFADDSTATTGNNSAATTNSAINADNSATTDSAINNADNSSDETPVVKSAGDICADLGILKGGANGKVDAEYLATSTQRIQAAIVYLRLLGLEDEAKAFDGTDNFADASKVADASAVKLMAYLKANPDLGWVGDGKNFNPTQQVSAQQFYKVLLTTLGYAQGEDFEYSETIAFAKFSGLSQIAKVEKLTNADMATAMVEALGCSFKGGSPSDTLISKLVNDGIVDAEKAIADGFQVNTNDVVSVEAPKAIDVVFGTAAPELPATVVGKLADGSSVDCDVTWDLAGAKFDGNKVGKYTISGKVDGFADGVTIDVNVKDLVLDVVSVDVPNLRQLVVTFNGAVSGDAVKNVANYTIKDKAPVDASLSDDGKVLTLTTSVADSLKNYSTDNKLVIKKDIGNGLAADKTVENIIARDTTVPTMLSVTATGPRTVKAVFSEPVSGSSIGSAFSLNDGKIGIDTYPANITANSTDTEITIKTLADLQEGAQTLKVSGAYLTDAAGYSVAGNTLSFNYAKDTAPLTVAVKSSNETSVTLKFNKDIVDLKDDNFQFSHTYKGYAASTVLGKTGGFVTGSGSEWTISFAGKPFPPGTTNLYISYVSSTGTKIKDGWGNELAETSLAITTSADTAAPTATAEFVDQNKVKVTYSEDVDGVTAQDKTNYALKCGTDTVDVDGAAFDTNSKKVVILTTKTINGGSLTLTIKNVKDISVAGNKMADTTLTFAASDKVPPAFADTKVEKISSKKIKVNFNEAMDVATITDKNMYVINAGCDIDTITAVNNNKSAVITFKADITGTPNVYVGKVKDVAGNYMASLQNDAGAIPATLSTIAIDSVDVTASNKVKLTVADTLASVGTITDYVYSIDGGSNWTNVSGIASFTVDTANNKSYVELTLGYTIADTNTDVTAPTIMVAATGSSIKNGLDQALAGSKTAADKLAPKLLSVTTGALDSTSTKLKTVIVTFSEALYVPSVSDSDFTVDGFTVERVAVSPDGKTVTITLADKDKSSGEKPKVTLTGSVEDANRNALTGPVEKTM